jgi:hypothetical protein
VPVQAADSKKLRFCLFVGAAEFEPTTCSTQNCRATRLRYLPISPFDEGDEEEV